MPDEQLSDDQVSELTSRVSAMDGPAVNARLLQLAAYQRPTAMQRAEHRMLGEAQIAFMAGQQALAAAGRGDLRMSDRPIGADGQPRPAGPGAPRRPAPAGRLADRALRSLSALHDRGLPDHAAAVADRLARSPMGAGQDPDGARDLAQRWLTVCGSPEYERAWSAVMRDPVTGGAELDEAERAAWRAGRAIQAAMGESGTGSYLVPVILDPAIQLSNAGANNPLRQVARVEQIATAEWHGVTSAGVTAEWSAEAAEAADASPTLAQPGVPVFKLDAFVPFSLELEGDAQDLMGQLSAVLVDAADLLSGATYTTGDGVAKPSGFVDNVTTTDNGSGAFAAADVYSCQNDLPPRFSRNASWLASIAVLNTTGAFETSNGALQFPEMRDTPPMLLRKPARELSDMTADMTTTGSKFLAYGSWRDAFLIVDRIGSSIELIPHLFGASQRPTGQRGAYLWMRTGSAVLIPDAARILIKTA